MEPYSFSQTFPFVPPDVLCNLRDFGFFSLLDAVRRGFRFLRRRP